MDILQKLPRWLTDLLPEEVNKFLDNGGWLAVLGVGALVVLLLLWSILRRFGGGRRRRGRRPAAPDPEMTEDLAAYPRLTHPPGPRQFAVEGLPVRLRLVVVAPAGTDYEINPATV